jgi:Helix-turn-helix domain
MFSRLLTKHRLRLELTPMRAARSLGMSPANYRELEAGERYPDFDAYSAICELFGWRQAFVGARFDRQRWAGVERRVCTHGEERMEWLPPLPP